MSIKCREKHIRITGPVNDLDRVLMQYVVGTPVVLENAVKELGQLNGIRQLSDGGNQYEGILKQAEELQQYFNITHCDTSGGVSVEESISLIQSLNAKLQADMEKIQSYEAQKEHYEGLKEQIEPFVMLDMELQTLFHLNYIDYQFGRMPRASYEQFKSYMKSQLGALVVKASQTEAFIYLVWFAPKAQKAKPGVVFKTLHFEKIFISDELKGTPKDAYQGLLDAIRGLEQGIAEVKQQEATMLSEERQRIAEAVAQIKRVHEVYEIRKKIAVTTDGYYILSEAVPDTESDGLIHQLKQDKGLCLITN